MAASIGSSSVARLRGSGRPLRQLAQAGVDRRRLAAPGRSRKNDRAGGLVEQVGEDPADLVGQAQVFQREIAARPGEQAYHGLLAVECWERGQPHLDLPPPASNPALLRDVVAVGQKIGQHFEPGDDVRRRPGGPASRRPGARRRSATAGRARSPPAGNGRRSRRLNGRRQHLIDHVGRVLRTARIESFQGFAEHASDMESGLPQPRPPSQQVSQIVRHREQISFPRRSTSPPPQTGQAGRPARGPSEAGSGERGGEGCLKGSSVIILLPEHRKGLGRRAVDVFENAPQTLGAKTRLEGDRQRVGAAVEIEDQHVGLVRRRLDASAVDPELQVLRRIESELDLARRRQFDEPTARGRSAARC